MKSFTKLAMFAANAVVFLGNSEIAFAKDVPFNSDYPQALFPYAKAPDGCSGWNDPSEVPDTLGPVDFTGSCNAHDRCYYTIGTQPQICNDQFKQNLLSACYVGLRIYVPDVLIMGVVIVPGYWVEPSEVALEVCNNIANTYHFVVVEAVAFGVFDDAQTQQRSYEEWIVSLPE